MARTRYAYALSGQSNARGNNAGDMSGTALGYVHLVDREIGAFAHGVDRSPTWWNNSPTESAPRVGPGAGMAIRSKASNPNGLFSLCKYAVGGSPIADWISTYAATHIAAMSATGWTYRGLVWVQGEEDAKDLTAATNYETSIGTLVGLYRATFPDLKVCIVKLAGDFTPLSGTADYIAEIRAAQEAYAASDALCTIINADEYDGLQHDGVHRTAEQQFVIGARALAALEAL